MATITVDALVVLAVGTITARLVETTTVAEVELVPAPAPLMTIDTTDQMVDLVQMMMTVMVIGAADAVTEMGAGARRVPGVEAKLQKPSSPRTNATSAPFLSNNLPLV